MAKLDPSAHHSSPTPFRNADLVTSSRSPLERPPGGEGGGLRKGGMGVRAMDRISRKSTPMPKNWPFGARGMEKYGFWLPVKQFSDPEGGGRGDGPRTPLAS